MADTVKGQSGANVELTPDGVATPTVSPRILLLAIGLGILTGPWNFTMLVVALPVIAEDLNVNLVTASWVIIVPMLASVSLQSIGGRLGDIFGYRRMFLVALVGFSIATVAATVAASFAILLVSRVIQVMFGGMTFPNGSALIRTNLPESRRASAYGVIGAAISIAITGGPFIGGMLTSTISWRAIFLSNLPFSILAFLLLLLAIPADRPQNTGLQRTLDLPGVALLILALSAIILPMTLVRDGFISILQLPIIYVGTLVIIGVFAWWELRQAQPIIQVRLYLVRNFRAAVSSEMFMNMSGFPITVVATIYLQTFQGRSALATGLVVALGTVGMALMSPVGGRVADRLGRRTPIVAGRIVMLVGLIIQFLTLGIDTHPAIVTAGIAVLFIGNGLALPPSQAAAIESAPRKYSGMAAGVGATTAFMGGIIGITASTVYLGETPDLGQFQVVYLLFIAAAVASILIATRISPWPATQAESDG